MLEGLKDRCGVVTGASRGIGAHVARALSKEGMRLALIARTSDAIARLADELSANGARAIGITADLSQVDQLETALQTAAKTLGPIDVLVNNAGQDGYRFFGAEEDSDIDALLRVNLLSPMLLTRRVLPAMLERRAGHIVNIASLAGKTPAPYEVTYAASKGGLIAFTHSLRAELLGTGVSASVICPGLVTGDGMFAKHERTHELKVNALIGTSRPELVARAVVRALCGDRAEIIVNPGPVRLAAAIQQLAPGAIGWLQDRIGVNGLLRRIALAASNPVNRHEPEQH
ncbi:MAG TPA: SDR family oxidoreductase [Polyangiales bacterium]|nr:SDR family oxidoreductase [Polyangiales bacterium]